MTGRPLRVAFVDYVLDPTQPGRSGLSDVVWDMASELVSQGHESHVIASYHVKTYPDARVIVHNFSTPPIGYRNVVGHFWILKRAADIARRLRPDIIHAPEYVSTAVFTTLGVPLPVVLTVPGNVFHRIRHGHSYEWYYLQILKWAARTSARRCASVIAISAEMKVWWEWTGSLPERTPWIPLGVNPNIFRYRPDARKRLGLAPRTLSFLFVGRFAPEKGLHDLLDALSRMKHLLHPSEVQFSLVGNGPQERELAERIQCEGLDHVVQLHSWVPQAELIDWYSAADALLLPSHSEALSRTIPQAMICGTPVIGSRITGTEDHVRDGSTGRLFPAGDVQALSDVLSEVVRCPDRLRQMRRDTMLYAQTHLTWPAIMPTIINDVYRPICERNFGFER